MKPRLTSLMSVGLATAFLAGPALAAQTTTYELTDGTGFTNFDLIGSINYTGNPPNYPPISFNGNVYIGPLNMQVTDTSNSTSIQQTVYCTDIFHDYNAGGMYTLSATNLTAQLTLQLTPQHADTYQAAQAANEATIKVNQISALLGNFLPLDAVTGAAIQASIWEIENEPGVTGYSLDTGHFTASVDPGNQAAFATDAAYDLAQVSGTNGSNGLKPGSTDQVWEYVVATGQNPNQSFSFLAQTGGGNNIGVPEPASLSLLGLGVLGLAAMRRRNVSKQPA